MKARPLRLLVVLFGCSLMSVPYAWTQQSLPSDASRSSEVLGQVRFFRPVPEFRYERLDSGTQGQVIAAAVADLDGDGACEIAMLRADGIEIYSVSGRTRLQKYLDIPFPSHLSQIGAGEYQLLAGGFRNRSRPDLVLADIQGRMLRYFRLDGKEVRIVEKEIPPEFAGARFFMSKVAPGQDYLAFQHGAAESPAVFVVSEDDGSKFRASRLTGLHGVPVELVGMIDLLGIDFSVPLELRRSDFSPPRPRWLVPNSVKVFPQVVAENLSEDLYLGELSDRISWRHSLIGDFNGDGREDIIVAAPPPFRSWILISRGTAAVEQQLSIELPMSPLLSAGDIDGDGQSDLVDVPRNGGAVLVWYSQPAPPVENAKVLCGSVSAISAADGSFSAHCEEGFSGLEGLTLVSAKNRRKAVSGRKALLLAAADEKPRGKGALVSFSSTLSGPFVCTGYTDPATEVGRWAERNYCPPNYAYMGMNDGLSGAGACCRLPSDDILLNSSEWRNASICQANEVVTGVEPVVRGHEKIRCTAINTAKYSLSEARPGKYWGSGLSAPGQRPGISRLAILPALRSALGRESFSRWDIDGCVGSPQGSLLVSAPSNDCTKVLFSELRTKETGSASGNPVAVLPACRKLLNEFDPLAGCE